MKAKYEVVSVPSEGSWYVQKGLGLVTYRQVP